MATLTFDGDKQRATLQRNGHQTVTVLGSFTNTLIDHLNGSLTAAGRERLQLLSRQYSAVADIEHASLHSNAYQQLICDDLNLLFIELTLRCNERCLHCYADSDPERSETLTADEVKRVLDECRTMGEPRVQFTGGDPLIHPELTTLVQYAHELQFKTIEIYTNGLLLQQPLLDKLSPFSPHFALSIYSHRADHHDAITRLPGSHQRTVDAIMRIIAMQLPIRVSTIVMDENREDLEETRQWLIELGVAANQIGSDSVRSTGRGSRCAAPRNGQEIHPIPPRGGKICISADGSIYPCIFSRNTTLGSIRQGSLREQLQTRAINPQPAYGDRWSDCQQRLTCAECQLSAWLLETPT
ncbi:MAG: radical SAM protein [Mariprofundales bacterium]|nr:radical SAM protein [Mariprofundales bacterium]